MLPYESPGARRPEPVNLEFMPALVIARLRALEGERGHDVPTLVSASGCGRIKLAFPLASEVVDELYSLHARLGGTTAETHTDAVVALAWFSPGSLLIHGHGVGPIRTMRRTSQPRAAEPRSTPRPTRSSVADSDAATLLDQLLDLKRTLEMERTRTINRVTVKAHVDKMIDTLVRSGEA